MDKTFARRLNEACDGHPHIPPYGQGRQTWVKERLGVSHEAVRKWFTGQSRPRPTVMKELARALEVDEAWLSLGITPDLNPKERRQRNINKEGASNVFMGLVQLNGGHVAFPSDTDPRSEYVDFYTILRGTQFSFHVSLAQKLNDAQLKFTLPKEYDQCTVIGAVITGPMSLHFVRICYEVIEQFKVRRGGYYELTVMRHGSLYLIGEVELPRVTSMSNF